jgi:hypothetical protein
MATGFLRARPFSEAKAALSELMSDVVRKHQPHLIERNHGRETMALIGAEELATVLGAYSLVPDVRYGRAGVTMSLEPLGLVASGSSLDEAGDAMLEDVRAYAEEFLERYDYFRHTSRSRELPWVLRFLLTSAEAQRELLFEKPAAAPAQPLESAAAR